MYGRNTLWDPTSLQKILQYKIVQNWQQASRWSLLGFVTVRLKYEIVNIKVLK